MMGLSTSGNISLGWALVAGRKRVPRPAAGKTALRTFAAGICVFILAHYGCVARGLSVFSLPKIGKLAVDGRRFTPIKKSHAAFFASVASYWVCIVVCMLRPASLAT